MTVPLILPNPSREGPGRGNEFTKPEEKNNASQEIKGVKRQGSQYLRYMSTKKSAELNSSTERARSFLLQKQSKQEKTGGGPGGGSP